MGERDYDGLVRSEHHHRCRMYVERAGTYKKRCIISLLTRYPLYISNLPHSTIIHMHPHPSIPNYSLFHMHIYYTLPPNTSFSSPDNLTHPNLPSPPYNSYQKPSHPHPQSPSPCHSPQDLIPPNLHLSHSLPPHPRHHSSPPPSVLPIFLP